MADEVKQAISHAIRGSILAVALTMATGSTAAAMEPITVQSSSPAPVRRIVLCLDGTWNSTYDEAKRDDGSNVLKPTNVLKLCRAVVPKEKSTGSEQIIHYGLGVGSLAEFPGTANHLLHVSDKYLGGVWAAGFESNIEATLSFLVLNYEPGDEIFIFGFSRGAATARGVTRFLDWSGGLPAKADAYYLPLLFRAFVTFHGERPVKDVMDGIQAERDRESARRKRPLDRLQPFHPIPVRFLGVWDTVMSLGSRFQATGASTSTVSKSFYVDHQPAQCVQHARQALAIDEARYDFRPEIWSGHRDGQTLEQRWFAGVHSNVGGGYVDDGLANVAFRWILKEAQAQGLQIDPAFIRHFSAYPFDRLYRSESVLYRFLDAFRFRFGRGSRNLVGQPAGANLSLSPSVIQRIHADPTAKKADGSLKYPDLKQTYRPKNVLLYLACQPDLEAYLKTLDLSEEDRQLPADALSQIKALRAQCGKGEH